MFGPSVSPPLDFLQSVQSDNGHWYQTLQKLGSGRNATTFLVMATGHSDANRGLLFALKMFHRVDCPAKEDEFIAEARFLCDCHHPAIMAVVDQGVFDGTHPFFVAEYLPNTLRDVIPRHPPVLEKLCYTIQLLSALVYLDRRPDQIVHRDIKPENIFLKGRSCVLGDFGLMLRLTADANTALNEPQMPKKYRTPDLVAFERDAIRPTTKSDVFQLGLVIAELFTGRNPLKESADKLAPIGLHELVPDEQLPVAIRESAPRLVAKMLLEDPADRPSAVELIDEWRDVFLYAARLMNVLEGKVFLSSLLT